MRIERLTLAVLGFVLAMIQPCVAQSLTIDLMPNKARYGPCDAPTVVVTLRDVRGVRVPYRLILVGDTWDRIRPNFNWQWYCTDAKGQVRLTYRIPPDPNKDNIYLRAAYIPWNLFVQKRSPIGL